MLIIIINYLVDRFRGRSIQFLSPMRNHQCDRQIQRSPGK